MGGVVVNQVIEAGGGELPEFVRNRVEMQGQHMVEIRETFGDQVRAVLPLYDDELQGVDDLKMAAGDLFA